MAKCPHCEGTVTIRREGPNAARREVNGVIKKEVLYSCPHCDKVLGLAFFWGGLWYRRP